MYLAAPKVSVIVIQGMSYITNFRCATHALAAALLRLVKKVDGKMVRLVSFLPLSDQSSLGDPRSGSTQQLNLTSLRTHFADPAAHESHLKTHDLEEPLWARSGYLTKTVE